MRLLRSLRASARTILAPLPDRAGNADALDGLRGIAVLLVFFSHAHAAGMHPFGAPYLSEGKRGVWIFFALSAYLLATPFIRKGFAAFAPAELARYAAKRALRVYPLFAAVLLASLLCTLYVAPRTGIYFPYQMPLGSFWRHLALQEAYIILWSVAVEMKFYLALPLAALVAVALPRTAAVALLLAGIVGCSIAWPIAEAAPEDMRVRFYLPVFLSGALWAALGVWFDRSRWGRSARAKAAIGWAGLAALATLGLATAGVRHQVPFALEWDELLANDLALSGLFVGGIVAALARAPGGMVAFLRWRPLRALGALCFGIYLLHFPALQMCGILAGRLGLNPQAAGALALALAWALAGVGYRLIERPGMALASRMFPPRRMPAVPVAASDEPRPALVGAER